MTMVTLEGVNCHLSLQRTPKYLRFTLSGTAACSRNWDALDKLDDEPQPCEHIVAARLKHVGRVHIDLVRKGRRVGEWRKTAVYELVDEQPSEETMRSTEAWQSWCFCQPVPRD